MTPREKIANYLEDLGIFDTFDSLKWRRASTYEDSGGYFDGWGKTKSGVEVNFSSNYWTMKQCQKGIRLIKNDNNSCLYGTFLIDSISEPLAPRHEIWEMPEYMK